MRFLQENNALIAKRQGETLRIEAWGTDSLRVRATMYPAFTGNDWALTEPVARLQPTVKIGTQTLRTGEGGTWEAPLASIENGRLKATVNHSGVLTFFKDGKQILKEYNRFYDGSVTRESHCLKVPSREWLPYTAGDYKLTVRFESSDGEKIFGMGQYQQPYLDMKGCVLELAQRNSQVSVPFMVSNLGYGFLWNNPAVGKVSFGKNLTEWVAGACKEMDYWITAEDKPRELFYQYTAVTGRAPMMREDCMGLWQCKLRYRTQCTRGRFFVY